MIVTIDIPDFDGNGVDVIWEKGSNYELIVSNDTVLLSANKEGLLSIAKQMIYLAQSNVPNTHIHYDVFFTGKVTSKYELGISKDDI